MPDTPKKILLAEDDKFIAKAMKGKLERSGFEVLHARDGEEALSILKDTIPDIMLLDLVMPKKGGFEVLAAINLDEKVKGLPVIILSNLGQDSDIQKGKELGAVDYMVKANFAMKEVLEKIQFHLAKGK